MRFCLIGKTIKTWNTQRLVLIENLNSIVAPSLSHLKRGTMSNKLEKAIFKIMTFAPEGT